MEIIKNCIYCGAEEVNPLNNILGSVYYHCFECKQSFTLKLAQEYAKLNASEKVYFRYKHIKRKNNDI